MASLDPFIHTKVVVLHESTPAVVAARAMCEHRIGSVLVSDHESHIVGVLTDRDLVCGLLAANLPAQVPLSEIMTRNPVVAYESSSVEDIIQLMKDNGIRRIPIIHINKGNQQKCTGIVTLDDLIAGQIVKYEDLTKIVASQIIRKNKFRHRQLPAETKSEMVMEVFIEDVAYNLAIDNKTANHFIRFVLGSIVERLHFTAALHLATQLPRVLEKELLEFPTGPNLSITADYIIIGVMNRLHTDEDDAKSMLLKFWKFLERGIGAHLVNRTLHQLPKDIQLLFTAEPPPIEQHRSAQI